MVLQSIIRERGIKSKPNLATKKKCGKISWETLPHYPNQTDMKNFHR